MLLRPLASRRLLLSAAGVAGAASLKSDDKLPIYPASDPELVLQEVPIELEKQIGVARRHVSMIYDQGYSKVQGVVDKWISVEQRVERRIKSFKSPNEDLAPGIFYVGVASLTGSIVGRSTLLLRFLLPPIFFVASAHHFLPETTHNITSYLNSLERQYAPELAKQHDELRVSTKRQLEAGRGVWEDGKGRLESGIRWSAGKIEDTTGLQLRKALGWTEEKGREVVRSVEKKAEEILSK
ncbi:hypothetical protein SISSUDRAFT_828146 [Sistotremastrum suecicum HHB10207 ss-3]|uniref:MICOS complex subunit n=1 Tax=Sistotremastrum suecicum HHB10207 ss-3 TaxID=1314776 RepID=A0A166CQ17_9AGAM|nr:hypothetical protein SISSUDRAFT_828146 [Sistotremastrum suecicum HHB10207 ss-3]